MWGEGLVPGTEMAHQRLAGTTSPSFSFQVGITVLPAGEAAGPITMGDPPSL